MMEVKVSKDDIVWSYVGKFFHIGTGLITLPFILHFLSANEIGLNYLMLSVGTLVTLLDFGFSPQFAKNITYVFSGVTELRKEGIQDLHSEKREVDYKLLSAVINTAKFVYRRISAIALILMLLFGTLYIYNATEGFSLVSNSLLIWILFSVSSFFNLYFLYYTSLLTGCGKLKEYNIAVMISRVLQIAICILLLIAGVGLFSVVLSNFISPFLFRLYCYKSFYTDEVKNNLKSEIASKNEIEDTFNAIWYNSKKMGINILSTYAALRGNIFIMGLFLPLSVVGSFGLLQQLASILSSVSMNFFLSCEPLLLRYRVENDGNQLKNVFSMSVVVYYFLMIIGSMAVIFLVPLGLDLLQSQTKLPCSSLCIAYLVIFTLEYNHQIFAELITTKNEIPFVRAYLLSGLFILLLDFLLLKYYSHSLWVVVLVEGFVELLYNNWKWPLLALRDIELSFMGMLNIGVKQIKNRFQCLRLLKG